MMSDNVIVGGKNDDVLFFPFSLWRKGSAKDRGTRASTKCKRTMSDSKVIESAKRHQSVSGYSTAKLLSYIEILLVGIPEMGVPSSVVFQSAAEESLSALNILSYADIVEHIKSLRKERIHKILRPFVVKLMLHPKNANCFNNPVDPVALNLPTYFSEISYPMDLGTVKSRLQRGFYSTIDACMKDIKLVFSNAVKFNNPAHHIHIGAQLLLDECKAEDLTLKEKHGKEVDKNSQHSCSLCSGSSCLLCGEKCLTYECAVLVCNSPTCGQRVKRNATYYISADGFYLWCQKCYSNLPNVVFQTQSFNGSGTGEIVKTSSREDPGNEVLYKRDLLKRRLDEEVAEPWVQCGTCCHWIHQICALYNPRCFDGEVPDEILSNETYECMVCKLEKKSILEKAEHDLSTKRIHNNSTCKMLCSAGLSNEVNSYIKLMGNQTPSTSSSAVKQEDVAHLSTDPCSSDMGAAENTPHSLRLSLENSHTSNSSYFVDQPVVSNISENPTFDIGACVGGDKLVDCSERNDDIHTEGATVRKRKSPAKLKSVKFNSPVREDTPLFVPSMPLVDTSEVGTSTEDLLAQPKPDAQMLEANPSVPPLELSKITSCVGISSPDNVVSCDDCDSNDRCSVVSSLTAPAVASSAHNSRSDTRSKNWTSSQDAERSTQWRGVSSVSQWKASSLPSTALGEFLEEMIKARLSSFGFVNVCDTITIRQTSNVDQFVQVPQPLVDNFMTKDGRQVPSQLPYRQKSILLFQTIDGVDICIFCLYVQEFNDSCPEPNKSSVYIAYLDSVEYFRPMEARTLVYHEILSGYLMWAQARGFIRAHIWACPPQRGDNFIFWCHPSHQKTPTRERLNVWYTSMIDRCCELGIVSRVTNFWEAYFAKYDKKARELEHQVRQAAKTSYVGQGSLNKEPTAVASVVEADDESAPVCPPIYEGDYWVTECLRIHRLIQARANRTLGGVKQHQKNVSNQRKCREILKQLMNRPDGVVYFNKPVDPVALRLPTYNDIIKSPMDLGTIRDRLRVSGFYRSVYEFSLDVRLTFKNAMLFNPVGHAVNTYAKLLVDEFNAWTKLFVAESGETATSTDIDANLQSFVLEKTQKKGAKGAVSKSVTISIPDEVSTSMTIPPLPSAEPIPLGVDYSDGLSVSESVSVTSANTGVSLGSAQSGGSAIAKRLLLTRQMSQDSNMCLSVADDEDPTNPRDALAHFPQAFPPPTYAFNTSGVGASAQSSKVATSAPSVAFQGPVIGYKSTMGLISELSGNVNRLKADLFVIEFSQPEYVDDESSCGDSLSEGKDSLSASVPLQSPRQYKVGRRGGLSRIWPCVASNAAVELGASEHTGSSVDASGKVVGGKGKQKIRGAALMSSLGPQQALGTSGDVDVPSIVSAGQASVVSEASSDGKRRSNLGGRRVLQKVYLTKFCRQLLSNLVPNTSEPDDLLQSPFLETRQTFIEMCQYRHLQFDSLRRAKHSSLLLLYHLHNPFAVHLRPHCALCNEAIRDIRWHCDQCMDYDICQQCYQQVARGSHFTCSDSNSCTHVNELAPFRVTFF